MRKKCSFVCLLVVVFLLNCHSSKTSRTNTIDNKLPNSGFISYKFELSSLMSSGKEALNFFKEMNKKGDTLIIDETLNSLEKFKQEVNKGNLRVDLHFFGDTIFVKKLEEKIIFIPEKFKRHHFQTTLSGNKLNFITGENYSSQKLSENYSYSIKIDTLTKNKILNKECFKIEIIETFKNKVFSRSKKYDLFVYPEIQIPFNFYEFLKLKYKINLTGLIMQANIYEDAESKYFSQLNILEYNEEKQNSDLIKLKTQ